MSASLVCRSFSVKGRRHPDIMLVGEGAGLDDVGPQRPFQGPSGVMLDKMMGSIGVRVSNCYTTNVIKCIPPRERNFSIEEIEACRPFLLRQILAVDPQMIIAFGALAAQTILRSRLSISNLRGRVFDFVINERRIVLVPTFNPAYLMRVPEKKREAWEDLKRVREMMKGMEFRVSRAPATAFGSRGVSLIPIWSQIRMKHALRTWVPVSVARTVREGSRHILVVQALPYGRAIDMTTMSRWFDWMARFLRSQEMAKSGYRSAAASTAFGRQSKLKLELKLCLFEFNLLVECSILQG